MICKQFCLIFSLIYISIDSSNCLVKGLDGVRHFKPMRMKYQPSPSSNYGSYNNYKTTAAPTTAASTTTAAPSHPSSNYGSGIQSLMNYGSSHNYQPLLVLLVPVPASYPNFYTTTTKAPETTTTPASTTEEYGYEPMGSYK